MDGDRLSRCGEGPLQLILCFIKKSDIIVESRFVLPDLSRCVGELSKLALALFSVRSLRRASRLSCERCLSAEKNTKKIGIHQINDNHLFTTVLIFSCCNL